MKRFKIRLIIGVAAILLLSLTSINIYTSYIKTIETVEETIANQSLESARSIASEMDLVTYKRFLRNPVENEYYAEITEYLNDARNKLGVLYVYVLEIDNPTVSRALAMGGPPKMQENFQIGDPCTVPAQDVREAYAGKTYITEVIEDPIYGSYLSVGAPIKDEENQILGYIGIDISTESLNSIKKEVIKSNIPLFIFNGLFILIVIGLFSFIQKWYRKELKKEVGYTEDTYQNEIKTLITSIASIRHDYVNHMQVVHGFLKLDASDKALQYLNSLLKETQPLQTEASFSNHPGLSILLQIKKLAAQNNHVEMELSISEDSFKHIKTTDLIKILSNLIDNAIEATIELPEDERYVSIHCESNDTHYIFTVLNTGPMIANKEEIFRQGYSTKKGRTKEGRGQGLFIVKEVVKKYDGDIVVSSSATLKTTAIVKIPKR